jgi:hypothetical protein
MLSVRVGASSGRGNGWGRVVGGKKPRRGGGGGGDDDDDAGHAWKYVSPAAAASFVAPSSGGGGGGGGVLVSAFGAPLTRLPVPSRLFSFGGGGGDQVRSIHWSPYDPVGVVNADP